MKYEPKPITKPQIEVTEVTEVTEVLARKIVRSGLQNDAFLLANEDQLTRNCAKLAKNFAGIKIFFGKYVHKNCLIEHSVEKQETFFHGNNISWNQIFSNVFSRNVDFTKFW